MGTITLAALKKLVDEATRKWDADSVEVDLESFSDFDETGDEALHFRVSDEWPYPLVLADTKTPNVKLRGAALLRRPARTPG